jgi:lipoprotein-releasing system permease protein
LHFPFYIARRYLFAKKSHHAINIITIVSAIGVMVGTMALVIVLSVFNGFEQLIMSLFNAFNPDLEITLAEGKTFTLDTIPLEEIQNTPGVIMYSEILEESGLLMYRDRQHLVKMRGVSDTFRDITGIDTLLTEGVYLLKEGHADYFLLGQGVAYMIGANINDLLNPVHLYIPKRGRTVSMHPSQAFNATSNYASGIFGLQSEFDLEYVLVPIRLARRMLDYQNEVSSLALKLNPTANHNMVQREIELLLGSGFIVKTRYQQQAFFYKIMRSEKWIIFLILAFIMIIAAFNVIGSLTMLVMEKQKDIRTLRSLGASRQLIQRIFLLEGVMISLGGAFAGIVVGAFVSWLQASFGLITIQAEGSYIIDTYPVIMKASDFVLVGLTVFCIGMLASFLPVKNMYILPEKIF